MNDGEFIDLDNAGMQAMLKSEGVQEVVKKTAENAAKRADGNYEVDMRLWPSRAIAKIKPADAKTYYRNRKHNLLLKAVKGGS